MPPCDYELQVTTSDKPNAGTTARVFFNLFGYKGATEKPTVLVSLPEFFQSAWVQWDNRRGMERLETKKFLDLWL
eukprot:1139326-Pelagomonas_calceolata.AAC.3